MSEALEILLKPKPEPTNQQATKTNLTLSFNFTQSKIQKSTGILPIRLAYQCREPVLNWAHRIKPAYLKRCFWITPESGNIVCVSYFPHTFWPNFHLVDVQDKQTI